uniref:Uncharacterized protein n=1 Tax=Anguilla anguilla TaxID=7936 RepID=A0A0E9UX46_ANGAN
MYTLTSSTELNLCSSALLNNWFTVGAGCVKNCSYII